MTKGSDLGSLYFSIEGNKAWIFELNAYKKTTDGEFEKANTFNSGEKMEFYVELGEDWDEEDIKVLFLDGDNSAQLDYRIEEMEINGVTKRFIVLELDHFSWYAVGETKPLS